LGKYQLGNGAIGADIELGRKSGLPSRRARRELGRPGRGCHSENTVGTNFSCNSRFATDTDHNTHNHSKHNSACNGAKDGTNAKTSCSKYHTYDICDTCCNGAKCWFDQ
jgi:hypothetical protein